MKVNTEGKIHTVLSGYFDLVWIGILWLVFSLPVVTFGASTTAMLTVLEQIRTGTAPSALGARFTAVFRGSFRRATKAWLCCLAALMITAADAWACLKVDAGGAAPAFLWGITVALLLLTWTVGLYVFPLIARLNAGDRKILPNVLYLIRSHPGRTLLLLVCEMSFAALVAAVPGATLFIAGAAMYGIDILLAPVFSGMPGEEATSQTPSD